MRYFFHFDDGVPNNDLDGIEFPNLDAVKRELHAGLRFWSNPDLRVRVTDEEGRLVLSVSIQGNVIKNF